MAMPSRKKMVKYSLLAFLVLFLIAFVAYFAPGLFTVTTYDEEGNPQREVSLFPFGGGGGGGFDIFTDEEDPEDIDENDIYDPRRDGPRERLPRLRMVDEGPVIGATLFARSTHAGLQGPATATTTDEDIENTIRYVELGTGHIYEASTYVEDTTRLSNTTIPRINQAVFVDGDRVLLRYTNENTDIKTFSAELVDNISSDAPTPKRLQGVFLADNIKYLSISPEGKLLSILPRDGGGMQIVTSTALGDEQTQVYTSPLSEWRADWFGSESRALLRSVPSYESYGVAYTLNTQNGATKPYTQARKALEVLPSSDRSVALVALKADGDTRLFVYRPATNQYIDLGIATFTEKCVWAEVREKFYCAVPLEDISEAEPDLWYQGVTQYSDEFWEIDPETGRTRLVLSPTGYTEDMLDVVDLQLSADEQFLYFRDKVTRSLWTLQIDYARSTPQGELEVSEDTDANFGFEDEVEVGEEATSSSETQATSSGEQGDTFFE